MNEQTRGLYNAQCTDQKIIKFFGWHQTSASYADILDELAWKDFFCSVFPVSTFATGNQRAWYPVLVYGDSNDWYNTRTEVRFEFMHTNWYDAIEEAIKKAIEIILAAEKES